MLSANCAFARIAGDDDFVALTNFDTGIFAPFLTPSAERSVPTLLGAIIGVDFFAGALRVAMMTPFVRSDQDVFLLVVCVCDDLLRDRRLSSRHDIRYTVLAGC